MARLCNTAKSTIVAVTYYFERINHKWGINMLVPQAWAYILSVMAIRCQNFHYHFKYLADTSNNIRNKLR